MAYCYCLEHVEIFSKNLSDTCETRASLIFQERFQHVVEQLRKVKNSLYSVH